VRDKTDEFLNLLLWTADQLMRPTFRNITDSYESWMYRNGLQRQVNRLQKRGLIERDPKAARDRLYRLTEEGRLHALGGRDPEVQWSRPWDGRWRLALFDVPLEKNAHRERLRRYLEHRGFGTLQRSVWITPDTVGAERDILASGNVTVNSLVLMEARPCAGETDAQIVEGAWDFPVINGHYARHLKLLEEFPAGPLRGRAMAKRLQCWAALEREGWLAAVNLDPLLPKCLLPPNYLGREAWQRRIEVLGLAGQQLQGFEAKG